MMAIYLSLLRIIALAKKEFLTIINDKGSIQVLIIPIFVQCILFGYGTAFDLKHVPYVYFDAASTYESRDLLLDIEESPVFELYKSCDSIKCLKENIENENALIGIFIDNDFNKNKTVHTIADARNTASANTAQNYVETIVNSYNKKQGLKPAFLIESRLWFNQNNITRFSILTAMILVLTFIQVLMLSSLSISRERENGSYDMMLMTPTAPFEILFGKALPTLLIAMGQGVISFLICNYYFGIKPQGNILAIFFSILCFNISVVGLGMMISVFAKNPMQSMIMSFLCLMPMVMCSGMLTTVDAMPNWFKIFVYLDPLYYGLNILWRVYLEGQTLLQVAHLFIPLCLIGAVTITLCLHLFRRSID